MGDANIAEQLSNITQLLRSPKLAFVEYCSPRSIPAEQLKALLLSLRNVSVNPKLQQVRNEPQLPAHSFRPREFELYHVCEWQYRGQILSQQLFVAKHTDKRLTYTSGCSLFD